MNWLRFLRRAGRSAQLTDELEFHLDAEIEANIARGMSAEAARLAANRKLGNPALIREQYRLFVERRIKEILPFPEVPIRLIWRQRKSEPGRSAQPKGGSRRKTASEGDTVSVE